MGSPPSLPFSIEQILSSPVKQQVGTAAVAAASLRHHMTPAGFMQHNLCAQMGLASQVGALVGDSDSQQQQQQQLLKLQQQLEQHQQHQQAAASAAALAALGAPPLALYHYLAMLQQQQQQHQQQQQQHQQQQQQQQQQLELLFRQQLHHQMRNSLTPSSAPRAPEQPRPQVAVAAQVAGQQSGASRPSRRPELEPERHPKQAQAHHQQAPSGKEKQEQPLCSSLSALSNFVTESLSPARTPPSFGSCSGSARRQAASPSPSNGRAANPGPAAAKLAAPKAANAPHRSPASSASGMSPQRPPAGAAATTPTPADVKLPSALVNAPAELVRNQPAWVYCTRYSDRPSSGPRTRRLKSKEKKSKDPKIDEKRPRTAFTSEQLEKLRKEFADNSYLDETRRKKLADKLNLHENQIKIWFQNKRAKMKKQNNQPNPLRGLLVAGGLYNHSTAPSDCSESYSNSGKDRLMADVEGDDNDDNDQDMLTDNDNDHVFEDRSRNSINNNHLHNNNNNHNHKHDQNHDHNHNHNHNDTQDEDELDVDIDGANNNQDSSNQVRNRKPIKPQKLQQQANDDPIKATQGHDFNHNHIGRLVGDH